MAIGIGNAWHIPDHAEPAGRASMRLPLRAIEAAADVTFVTGNQFQGPGVTGNQTQTGSALLARKSGAVAWMSLPMAFFAAAANNKYFIATIPANTFQPGDLVDYYFRIGYTDRQTTFLHGNDAQSLATDTEATAQSSPFTFAVRSLLAPSGPFLSFNSGSLQAQIFKETGHLALAGPDLAGTALANVVTLAPPSATVAGHTFPIGAVVSSSPLANGLEVIQAFGAGTVRAQLTFPMDGIMRYEVVDWTGTNPSQTSFAVASSTGEHVYGLGEKFDAFDQTGRFVLTQTFDNPGDKGDRSYKVAPWFVSTRGYGAHLDSTAESTFDLGHASSDRFEATNPVGTLRLHIVFGPRLADVIGRYTGLTGRPSLPPPWAFGPWISSDVWRSGGEVRYAVTKFRERQIPVSAFVFDSPWSIGYNDFNFNMTQFGQKGRFEGQDFDEFTSFDELMTFFQQNGFKVICWLTPLVNVSSTHGDATGNGVKGQNFGQSANYQAGKDGGFFVRQSPGGPPRVVGWWKGKGSHVDFTNPAAATWFAGQLKALRDLSRVATKSGTLEPVISGFKTDDGEGMTNKDSPDTAGGVYISDDSFFSDGRTGVEMRNGYCSLYHKTVAGVLGTDGLLFARSGFTGTQAFPGCWAGDNQPNFGAGDGLPSVIVAGLSAAMSGFAIWGHDVGAYQENFEPPPADVDLFIRWAQVGCFSPIMQMHRQVTSDQADPQHLDLRQYPWGFHHGNETIDNNAGLTNYRIYADLHTRLFPYIYSFAKAATATGLPIIRPLVLIDQDDANTHTIEDTYHFGDAFLVAPILAPGIGPRQVYLPAGTWIDFWDNTAHAGRQKIQWTNADRTKFPLFVRKGSIVPMLLGGVATLCDANYVNGGSAQTWDGGLQFRIHPDVDSQFTLFDLTAIRCQVASAATRITLTSTSRAVQLSILGPGPSGDVKRDGVIVSEAATLAAFASATQAWRHDPATGFLDVKFSHAGGTTIVSF